MGRLNCSQIPRAVLPPTYLVPDAGRIGKWLGCPQVPTVSVLVEVGKSGTRLMNKTFLIVSKHHPDSLHAASAGVKQA